METIRQILEIELGWRDCWYFLTHFCYTDFPDPTDPTKRKVDLFPDKDYLRETLEVIQKTDKLLIVKSRQIMLTWLCVAYCFWMAATHKNLEIIFQSDKEDKVKGVLFRRMDSLYKRLPPLMKAQVGEIKELEMSRVFKNSGSKILGTPSGESVIASYNPNIIFSDEMARQEHQAETIAGSLPAINNGGKFIGISSVVDDTFFMELVEDIGAMA